MPPSSPSKKSPSASRHRCREGDLALTEGEALGIIGPNGAGKTALFGIATGTVAAVPAACAFDGGDMPPAAAPALYHEHRALVPDPQPFGGMTVFGISSLRRPSAEKAASIGERLHSRASGRLRPLHGLLVGWPCREASRYAGLLRLSIASGSSWRARATSPRASPRRGCGQADRT
jgi:energy-coupling factor transporter ATP-binding protein EcfA2